MVDDQLGLCAEKILERDWTVGALEGVGLCHRDHGKGTPLSLDGIRSAVVLFLLGQKRETGCTIFLGGCNLMLYQVPNIYDLERRGTNLARHCDIEIVYCLGDFLRIDVIKEFGK
jgi:hypothetical protein